VRIDGGENTCSFAPATAPLGLQKQIGLVRREKFCFQRESNIDSYGFDRKRSFAKLALSDIQ